MANTFSQIYLQFVFAVEHLSICNFPMSASVTIIINGYDNKEQKKPHRNPRGFF